MRACLQFSSATGEKFEMDWKQTGCTIKLFHCNAKKMTNIIPDMDYCTLFLSFLSQLLCFSCFFLDSNILFI